MVEVQHNNGYVSRYAHFSRIAKGIRAGKSVSQGELVGYVGQTGHATGPHLHFEMLNKGRKINFLNLKTAAQEKLTGAELQAFLAFRDKKLPLLKGIVPGGSGAGDCRIGPLRSHRQGGFAREKLVDRCLGCDLLLGHLDRRRGRGARGWPRAGDGARRRAG